MQVTETLTQGLKREFSVTLPASDLASRADQEIETLRGKVQLKGFRPGKVPTAHLKRVYGKSVMADVVQNAVNEANRKLVEERAFKLALDPQIAFPEDQGEIARVMNGEADLSYRVMLEVLPTFEVGDFSGISVERLTAQVPDEDVQAELGRLARQNRSFVAREGEGLVAAAGDRVTVDFLGQVDGVPFEGGKGEDIKVELGSDSFIPGFEEGLVGAGIGEPRTVTATFPAAYARQDLAGKEAVFDVTVKAIEAPGELVVDDSLATALGLDTLANLEAAIRENLGRELGQASRARVKRAVLDGLDTQYAFDLPGSLVEQEFASVWRQVETDLKSQGKSLQSQGESLPSQGDSAGGEGGTAEGESVDGQSTDDMRAEYRRIAERRVRLGLVLAQIGEQAGVEISDDEVTQALVARARQFPGQEKMVWEYYRKNANALAELRAPIFEEKVIDHILSKANVTDRTVTRDELLAEMDEPGAGDAQAAMFSPSEISPSEISPSETNADAADTPRDDANAVNQT